MTAFRNVVDALVSQGLIVQDRDNTAMAQCPAHNDGRPSLSVRKIEGQVLLYCMAGCSTQSVVDALDMKMADLFDDPDGYSYNYPGGRIVHRTPEKKFFQRGDTTDTSLFHADKLTGQGPFYVVEGEKDVLAIESVGGQAVTTANGASANPNKYDWSPLKGKIVYIVADKDEPGQQRAQRLMEFLEGTAMTVSLWEPLVGKDAADHIAAGHSLDEFRCKTTPDLLSFSQAMDAWRAWRESEHVDPIPTPWYALNRHIAGGLHPSRLYVVGARTGAGKSVLGVNIAAHAADLGHSSLVVSVEMPHIEITSRVLAAQAHVSYGNITQRNFDADAVTIDQYIADHRQMPLYICDKATITMEEVMMKCRMLRNAAGLELAFIDYAQLISPSTKSVPRQEQVSHIARSAKLLAMELNIPVILAAQLNRNADSGDTPRAPRMTDLRESGELEQSADVIILLDRDEVTGNIVVSVPKNRTGQPATLFLRATFDEARIDS